METRHDRTRRFAGRRISLRHVMVLLVCLGLGAVAAKFFIITSHAATTQIPAEAESGSHTPAASVVTDATASGGQALKFGGTSSGGGSCIAPAGLKEADLDASHGGTDQIPPWPHTYGSAATIYFATNGLPAEYAGYLNDGAAVWNASPCIHVVVTPQCPASSNCVTGILSTQSGTSYDGQFEGFGNAAYTYLKSGTITFVTAILDKESVAYRRMVTVHEMGHAVSLGHRLTTSDVMNWASDETVALKADSINLNNILAVYGVKSDATSAQPGAHTTPAADLQVTPQAPINNETNAQLRTYDTDRAARRKH